MNCIIFVAHCNRLRLIASDKFQHVCEWLVDSCDTECDALVLSEKTSCAFVHLAVGYLYLC